MIFQVPGNQGNWWHFLAGLPFLLAYPMIWIRTRALFSTEEIAPFQRNLLWSTVVISLSGTMLVLVPFLFHLAGTSDWQRLEVSGLVLGITLASAIIVLMQRTRSSMLRTSLIGLHTAYLANAGLCLVVYSGAEGDFQSRSGWFLTLIIVWPILFGLLQLWLQVLRGEAPRRGARIF